MKLSATAKFTPRNDAGQFIAQRVTPAVVARMEQAGALVEGIAKVLCPVDTGELRDSISHRVDVVGQRVIGTIYASADHAPFVEFGYGKRGAASPGAGPYSYGDRAGARAQPFLRPSLDEARTQIKDLFTSEALLTE